MVSVINSNTLSRKIPKINVTLFPSDLRTSIYFVPVPSAIDWALNGGMGRTKSKKPSKHHNPRDGVFLVCVTRLSDIRDVAKIKQAKRK